MPKGLDHNREYGALRIAQQERRASRAIGVLGFERTVGWNGVDDGGKHAAQRFVVTANI